MLNKKVERDEATNLFFVLVRLNGLAEPDYYVVPKEVVADFARANHERWLSTPGKNGQQHVDTPIRQFMDPEDKYRGRWDLLGLNDE